MTKFVLAVKRAKRGTEPADWVEQVARIPGITLSGSPNSERAQIETEGDADGSPLEELRRIVGDYCHIEPIISHHRSELS